MSGGVGICVPVLDEREALPELLDRLDDALGDTPRTVCFVDGGSVDGTVAWIRERATARPDVDLVIDPRDGPGCQRGRASRRGLEWLLAHSDHAAFVDLDADGSQRPEELPAGLARLAEGDVDVVVASKYAPGARVLGRPHFRRLGSRLYNSLLRVLLAGGLRDYSNSYRFYTRSAAALLLRHPIRYDGPIHLLEMLAIWLSAGKTIVEIPTRYEPRSAGASKVIPTDALRGFAGALEVGTRYRLGRYAVPPAR